MVRKRPIRESPPPAASSSDEEDGVEDVQDDVVEEDNNEEEEESSPAPKNPTVNATPSKSDLASDSEPECDSIPPSPSPSAFTIKPIIPKPTTNKPDPAPKEALSNKNDKKEGSSSSSAIQLLWSEDDEIAILNGMIRYRAEKGKDPYADMGAFHEFVKKSLHVDGTKNQLVDKIRRMKRKYKHSVEKYGEGDLVFSNPHDLKAFQLSKKIWGGGDGDGDGGDNNSKRNDKAPNNGSGGGITLGLASQGSQEEFSVKKRRVVSIGEVKSEVVKREEKGNDDDVVGDDIMWEKKYPCLSEALEMEMEREGLTEWGKEILRENSWRIGKGKMKELEGKWRRLRIAQLELFKKKTDLVREQVKSVLEAIRSKES